MPAPDVRVVPATMVHAEQLAPRMRADDVAEVLASAGFSPLEALAVSLKYSSYARALLIDGEPAALWGVCPSTLPGTGIVWALTGDLVDRHRRTFWRASRAELPRMLEHFPRLTNCVDARYTRAVRWLRRLGFSVAATPRPFGTAGLPFHPFYIEADHV